MGTSRNRVGSVNSVLSALSCQGIGAVSRAMVSSRLMEDAVKTLVVLTAALILMGAAPAIAMSCCGGGSKGKAGMCAKGGGMAMNTKGKKSRGCCGDGMDSNMSKRT